MINKGHKKGNDEVYNFIKYLNAHPTQRLWQALRNFSKSKYILKSTHFEAEMFNQKWLKKNKVEIKDTFYETK